VWYFSLAIAAVGVVFTWRSYRFANNTIREIEDIVRQRAAAAVRERFPWIA
jgi:hypothetical protein